MHTHTQPFFLKLCLLLLCSVCCLSAFHKTSFMHRTWTDGKAVALGVIFPLGPPFGHAASSPGRLAACQDSAGQSPRCARQPQSTQDSRGSGSHRREQAGLRGRVLSGSRDRSLPRLRCPCAGGTAHPAPGMAPQVSDRQRASRVQVYLLLRTGAVQTETAVRWGPGT